MCTLFVFGGSTEKNNKQKRKTKTKHTRSHFGANLLRSRPTLRLVLRVRERHAISMPPAKGFKAAVGMSTSLGDVLDKLTIPDLRYLAFLMEMPYNEALKKSDNVSRFESSS